MQKECSHKHLESFNECIRSVLYIVKRLLLDQVRRMQGVRRNLILILQNETPRRQRWCVAMFWRSYLAKILGRASLDKSLITYSCKYVPTLLVIWNQYCNPLLEIQTEKIVPCYRIRIHFTHWCQKWRIIHNMVKDDVKTRNNGFSSLC